MGSPRAILLALVSIAATCIVFFLFQSGMLHSFSKYRSGKTTPPESSEEPSLPPPGTRTKQVLDFPEALADFMIFESMVGSLAPAELLMLNYLLAHPEDYPMNNANRKLAKAYVEKCQEAIAVLNGHKSKRRPETNPRHARLKAKDEFFLLCDRFSLSPPYSTVKLKVKDEFILLYDPMRLVAKLEESNRNAERECSLFPENCGNERIESEVHGFMLYYANIHRKACPCRNVRWKPNGSWPEVAALFDVFSRAGTFEKLDRYLQQEGFKATQEARGRFWLVIYFEYVRHAVHKGYINMALRQFLGQAATDRFVVKRFPEMVYLHDYLVLLQRFGLMI